MTALLHAEWIKLRSLRSTHLTMVCAIALGAGLGVLDTASVAHHWATMSAADRAAFDPVGDSFTGLAFAQLAFGVLGVLTISSEYGTGMIRTTLTAMPRRTEVLAAKAVVLTGGVLVAGTAGVLSSLVAGRLVLPGHGFPPLALAHGPTLRAAGGSVLYLALIALLSLGIATLVRDPAAAIGIVLGLLYLFPILLGVVTSPTWQRRIEQVSPSNAGLAIQATTRLHGLPLSPWAGLGVLAVWAAAALVAGGALLARRDV